MCGVAIGVLCSLGVFILWVKADSGKAGSERVCSEVVDEILTPTPCGSDCGVVSVN